MIISRMNVTAVFGLFLLAVSTPGAAKTSARPLDHMSVDYKDGQNRIVVRHGDLDLSTAAGQRALNSRIASAVRRVCSGTGIPEASYACRRNASMEARPQMLAAINRSTVQLAGASRERDED